MTGFASESVSEPEQSGGDGGSTRFPMDCPRGEGDRCRGSGNDEEGLGIRVP